MCGRYALHAHPEVVALQFGLAVPPVLKARYNICPGTDVLGVQAEHVGVPEARDYRWGLIPHWAKDAAIGHRLANARGESVAERPAFRDAFRHGRCLVPASGYYEWQSVAGAKHPWYLRPLDAPLFGLAGISARWQGPAGPVLSVALITTAANELSAPIHGRMPVIVAREDYAAWLDPQARATELERLIRPYPAERMAAHAVSRRVNRPANDDPSLVEPLPGGPAQSRLL